MEPGKFYLLLKLTKNVLSINLLIYYLVVEFQKRYGPGSLKIGRKCFRHIFLFCFKFYFSLERDQADKLTTVMFQYPIKLLN